MDSDSQILVLWKWQLDFELVNIIIDFDALNEVDYFLKYLGTKQFLSFLQENFA
jgi:hypothetical protein